LFAFLRRGGLNEEERLDAMEYMHDVSPLFDKLNREYSGWLTEATDDGKTLSLERDPDGQHAAVYLYRVSSDATEFVQRRPVPAAAKYHEGFALCLEARAAAADSLKEAADYAGSRDPGSRIAHANHRLAEAERQLDRARQALRRLEDQIGPH
jgi:hypothetical protein